MGRMISTAGATGAALGVLCTGIALHLSVIPGWPQKSDGRTTIEFVETPLPAADRAYGVIDGNQIHKYVVEQAEISEHYRDDGHPQFWGRITGTSGDVESQQWLAKMFTQVGLTNVHVQPIDMPPQWIAKSWSVSAVWGGKSVPLTSAEVAYRTPATPASGLDLEVVYAGLGSEADFQGRDVKGKAVLLFSMAKPGPSSGRGAKRAEDKGAAAIFTVEGLPGNMKYQSYDVNTHVPTFSLGGEDGQALREMIAQAGTGDPPHLKIQVDAGTDPSTTKTGLVFATLPGASEETIYIIAHRDGWFDAAGDNGGGVAVMVGLAEYFAKIPQSQRRRTMVFIGLDGHHQIKPGGYGREWLVAHRNEFFSKTALMINCEHPSDIATSAASGGATDTTIPLEWYAGGASRPQLTKLAADAFREFGVTTWAQPSVRPPGGDIGRFFWFVPAVVVQSNDFLYFHTDRNTPDSVPASGLEQVARAYAKIIDEVNKIDLKDLQQPALSDPNAPGSPTGYLGG
jgi:Peptidase family M28/PA domain